MMNDLKLQCIAKRKIHNFYGKMYKTQKKSDIDDIHLITQCHDINLISYQARSLNDDSLAQITWHLIIQGQSYAAFIVQNKP